MGLFSSIGGALKSVASFASDLSPLGSVIGAGLGYLGQQNTNEANANIASANNAISLDIAKHGMQYKVADLQAAGLNPALAYNSGPINMPNLSTPVMQNSGAAAAQGGLAASQAALANAQVEASKSQADLNSAQADKARTETAISALDYQKSLFLKDNYSSWDVAGSGLDASRARSVYEQAQSNNDSNALTALNRFAVSQGYDNYLTAIKSVDFLQALADLTGQRTSNTLSGLQIPQASADAAFYSTDFGKSIAPYMSTAKDLSAIGTSGVGALRSLKTLRAVKPVLKSK